MVARRRRARLSGVALALPALVLAWLVPRAAVAHPLHTSLTAVTYDGAAHTLNVSVRVFAVDFLSAARATSPDAPAVAAYLASHLSVAGADGRAIVFASCGTRRVGELLWLCLRAPVDARVVPTLRARATLLCEQFADQINMVQAEIAGRRSSALFTRGDGARALLGSP